MLAPRTTSTRKTILQRTILEAGKPSPTASCNVLLSPTISPYITFIHRYQRTPTSSIVSSIHRFGRILGGRVGYLRRLSIFKVPDSKQDVDVFPVLCQRGVCGYANPTHTGTTTEYRFQTAGGFEAFERGRFVPLKDGFCEVEAAFALSVTVGARGRWYKGGRISRIWNGMWMTMVIGP